MCVVQARATDSGLSRWLERAAAKLGSKACYCTINIKHFNIQPQLIFYWLKVAVTGRDHCEVSMCG